MSRMMQVCMVSAAVMIAAINGCSSSVKMAYAPTVGQTATYESSSSLIKDFKFEQPTLNKSREEQTSTLVTVIYDQKIAEVQPDGSAVADITIKAVQCKMVNKNEVRYEFNSADEKNKTDTLNSIVGKGYRIAISPEGKVTVVDATAARAVVVSGEGQKIAQKIFMDESIKERHQLPMPAADKNVISAKKTWSSVQPSPPGLLAPKTFEKIYTVSEAGKDKVVVTMAAKESLEKTAENQAAGASSMGIFAKMFDNQDQFTGTLVMNPTNGTVSEYNETLVSSYVAQEKPQNAPADAAPDTLLMQLTYSISLKKLN
ncbi:MAG: hypothetical protein ABFD91_03335 [Anaerohalosphaeraceae bacterium]